MHLRLMPLLAAGLGALLVFRAAELASRAPGVAHASSPAPAQGPPAPATTTERPAEQAPPAPPTSEQALGERLAERRRQLEERARELNQREALLAAAERRMTERLEELKRLEARIDQTVQQRQDEQNQQIRSLVVMYENMKAQEAARIFDRLDLEILVSLATRMNPRRMSEVLAAMQPEAAQRLTVELARRSGATARPSAPPPAAAPAPAGARELPRVGERGPG